MPHAGSEAVLRTPGAGAAPGAALLTDSASAPSLDRCPAVAYSVVRLDSEYRARRAKSRAPSSLRLKRRSKACASRVRAGVAEKLAPRYQRSLRGASGRPSLWRAMTPAPSFHAPQRTHPAAVERRSLRALLVRPANAPGPPRISSTASAMPQALASYLSIADHCRQALESPGCSPGQLVPAGPGPELTASRPRL